MNEGFILIHRKIIKEWEWYNNINDRLVWFHCLLSANWCDGWYNGIKIPRGSFVSGRKKLANEIGITEQQVRTSLDHLKSTNNITIKSYNKYSIITINNYDKYQLATNNITNNQPTSNQQVTNNQPTSNHNIINNNKEQLITMKNNNKETISNDIVKKVEKKYFESLKVNTIFNEFLELRKKLKAVNSERAINTLINKLNEYDEDTQYEMIEQSIVNSWKGIFELKNNKNRGYLFSDLLKEENYE